LNFFIGYIKNIFILAKRLSDSQKNEILKGFSEGKTVEELSEKFNCTKLTISRNLKNFLDEQNYKKIFENNKLLKKVSSKNKVNFQNVIDNNLIDQVPKKIIPGNDLREKNSNQSNLSEFIEIAPISFDIDNAPQKDLSSIPLSDINLPKIVYMIVDNKIELETKLLKDYPEWQFLSQEDLNRKTLKIYFDQKTAKRDCNKDQKVIKVPNPNVFKIVAPFLLSRGISRIVSDDRLIAL
tara:strand:- start:208 stop:921 length:714 start_codon:yes stop_codon:yes gene_type:complete